MSKRTINHVVLKYLLAAPNRQRHLKRVVIDRDRRFLYNRVRKNANTFVTRFLYSAISGIAGQDDNTMNRQAKRDLPNLSNTLVPLSLAGYRSLLIIRNPHTRVLSAFLEKFRHDRYREAYGDFEPTPAGFETFIRWLEDGGLSKDPHWDLQTNEIAFDMSFFTDVIRFEAIGRDLPALFAALGYDSSMAHDEKFRKSSAPHSTRSDSLQDDFLKPGLKSRIERLYERDFDCFAGYY